MVVREVVLWAVTQSFLSVTTQMVFEVQGVRHARAQKNCLQSKNGLYIHGMRKWQLDYYSFIEIQIRLTNFIFV